MEEANSNGIRQVSGIENRERERERLTESFLLLTIDSCSVTFS